MRTATGNLGEGGGRRELQADSTSCESGNRRFKGTGNPRHLRTLNGLLRRPMPREHIDREAGCSNGPELVAELRRRGLEVPCGRVPAYDRDGLLVTRGVYYLTLRDRRKVHQWLSKRGGSHE